MGDPSESVTGRRIHNGDYTSTHGANVLALKMSACHSAEHAVLASDKEIVVASHDTPDMFALFEPSLFDENGNTV